MAQILVVTNGSEDGEDTVVYRERISTRDLESAHFSGQLVERVGWAVRDARMFEGEEPADLRDRRRRAGLRTAG